MQTVGQSASRKEAADKVLGVAKFTNDYIEPGVLHAALVTSTQAHARLKAIDLAAAHQAPGVRAIVTGADEPTYVGPLFADRPILALEKVRYHGEPIAVVVADTRAQAESAARLVQVQYEPLPVIHSPSQAFAPGCPLVHERMNEYKTQVVNIYPFFSTNIANHTKIRKGNLQAAWAQCQVIVEGAFRFPISDHAALEQRSVRVEIKPDGQVVIDSATQSPFVIKKMLNHFFKVDNGKITVHTPLVGGAFGGKGAVHLEFIAYVASRAVGGRPVKLTNSREQDMISSPCHVGLEAKVKLGATQDGKLVAAEYTYLFDGGAYSDMAANISKSAASDCTGPYRVEHVSCDSYCLYTNHPFCTSFRSFGHIELHFPMERMMDLLAQRLGMDPFDLRLKNAVGPGDTTPTRTILSEGTVGNVTECLTRLRAMMHWEEGQVVPAGEHKVRAKGIAALWKTSSTPKNAGSGAVLTFNRDGSVNLNCGVVEIGGGTKTAIAQIAAERLKIGLEKVHVVMDVDTQSSPEHWKTVASTGTFMAGRAVMNACDDAITQLTRTASIVLRCMPDELEVGNGRVFLRHRPDIYVDIRTIALGYKYPNGNAIEGQVIGRGRYVVHHLSPMDPETGAGNPGPWWTVGAQGVEIELDTRDYTYRILKAYTVMDPGRVIFPEGAKGQMTGGMCMGLSFAAREAFAFDDAGMIQNPDLRRYKLLRLGEQPEYFVDFVESPEGDGPYGARGLGEYGVIGMPGALANSLSAAAGVALNRLPLTPEEIWRTVRGNNA